MYEVTRFVNQGAREIDPKQEIAQSRDFLAKVSGAGISNHEICPKMDGGVQAYQIWMATCMLVQADCWI